MRSRTAVGLRGVVLSLRRLRVVRSTVRVEPAAPRYRVERLPGGVRVTIPSPRNWFVVPFLSVWLVAWWGGATAAIKVLLATSDQAPVEFMMVWFAGWMLAGCAALLSVRWQLAGREVVEIATGVLERRAQIASLGSTREVALSEVRSLRVCPMEASALMAARWAGAPLARSAGPVAFDYGARTIRFAAQLDEAEARGIVEQLNTYVPFAARMP